MDVAERAGDRRAIPGGVFRGHTRGLLVSVPGENYWPPMGTFPCPPSPTNAGASLGHQIPGLLRTHLVVFSFVGRRIC